MLLFYNKDLFDEAGLPYPPSKVECIRLPRRPLRQEPYPDWTPYEQPQPVYSSAAERTLDA